MLGRFNICFLFGTWVLSQGVFGQAGAEPDIKEWEVPYPSSGPRDPFVDGHGRPWFCGQLTGYLANLDPETGVFTKYELEEGVGPHNLIIDGENKVWFAANTKPYIGRLDPKTGDIKKFPLPADQARDPHTLVFDRQGNIWFTSQRSNAIGRLNTTDGTVELVTVPIKRSRPYGIKLDGSGRPWVALFGTHRLATVDPKSMELDLVELPRREIRPRRLEVTADGNVWYGDYATGVLGRYTPSSKKVTEWAMPGGSSAKPYGTALDDKGRLWLAEGGAPNRLVAFDTKQERFVSVTEVPNSKGAIRHMYFEPTKREIWFGEDSNFLGRAKIP